MKLRKVLPVLALLIAGAITLISCGPAWNYETMFVRGGFNGWSGDTPMKKAGSHEWKVDVPLKKGTYEFKFEISGTQNWDEKNHWGAADDAELPAPGESKGQGVNPGQNIVINVPEDGTYEIIFNDDSKMYDAHKK